MLRWIVDSSLKFRLLVVATGVAALVVGATQVWRAPVEVLPDFTPTTVEVQTEALGLSAAEVEQLITVPIEQDLLNGIAFLEDIRSESVPGLSRILMVFEPGTDVFKARQVVAERLTQAHALPQVSKPPRMLQPLSSTDRVLLVGMSSKTVSPLEMGVLARWTIAPRLVGVPGVANVAVWGQRDRELQVQVDPERLRRAGVRLDQVVETSANALWVSPLTFVEASTPGTGGFIDTPNQRLGIQHESPISTAADLAQVRLEGTNGRKLVLADVANVVEGHQPLIGDAGLKGAPALLLVIQRFPGTNLLEVTRGVERAVREMQPGLAGIEFDTNVYRPASYVERSIDNLRLVLLIGLGLLALAFAAFFFRWRAALVAIVVVPLSLVAAVLVLWAFGSTVNAIVVAGLAAAAALVIDDAVATVANVTRRLEEDGDEAAHSTVRRTLEASLEVRRPLLYATLVAALATVPLFFLEQLPGAFFPDLAAAYLVALLASMLVALTVTPALCALLLSSGRLDGDRSPLAGWLHRRYEAGLARVVHRPRLAYLALGALLVVAAVSAPFLGQSLLPAFREDSLLIRWNGPPGTSLSEMNRVTALASHELRGIPGVVDVGTHVGRAVTGDQVVGVNSSEVWVTLDPAADHDATVASVRRVVAAYPGLSRDVETYSGERVQETLTGANEDVVVRVYGEDLATLSRQAAKVRQAVASVDGIRNAHVLLPAEEPTVQVRVDLAKAERVGIKPGDVRRAATTLLSGLVVGSLFEQQKVFDVVVWGTPSTRASLTSVRRLLIDTPSGGHVRLGDVAGVRVAPSPGVIKRQSVSRYVDVGASVGGRDRDAVVSEIERRLQSLAFPIEYHAQVLAAETQPTGLLVAIAVAAAIGMFLLLQALFESWRLAALCFLTVPFGVTGGVVAALAAGGTLTFGSYAGLLAVFALAVRGAVLLFDRFRALQADERMPFDADLIVHGARDRLVPVLTTALALVAICLPVLALGARPGLELVQPVAVVTVGGLATSALVTTLVLPVVYFRFGFSRAAEPEAPLEPEALTAALDERARGHVAGVPGSVAAGLSVTEARAMPERPGD